MAVAPLKLNCVRGSLASYSLLRGNRIACREVNPVVPSLQRRLTAEASWNLEGRQERGKEGSSTDPVMV